MFRIVQVFNNNVALVHAQDDKQAIVMGKGLIFKKKKGDLIQNKDVEKTFVLKDKTAVNDLTTLLKNVPINFVTISYDLIKKVQTKYHYTTENYIYVTLTTHLYGVYQKYIDKEEIINYLPNLSDDYPIPYKMAQDLLRELGNQLQIVFPKQEVKSVALHFINAHVVDEKKVQDALIQEEQINQLVALFRKKLANHGIESSKSPINYDRLMVHLKYFVARLDNAQFKENKAPISMINGIKFECPEAWRITDDITKEVRQQLNMKVSATEQIYLTLHIQRLLDGGLKNGRRSN